MVISSQSISSLLCSGEKIAEEGRHIHSVADFRANIGIASEGPAIPIKARPGI